MGSLVIINVFILLSVGIVYTTPCHEEQPPCKPLSCEPSPPCESPPPPLPPPSPCECPPPCKPSPHESPPCESPPCYSPSTSVHIDIEFYANIFTNCKYVDNKERDIYLAWIEKCHREQLEYIEIIVNYLQSQEALTVEIIDYQVFQKNIVAVYEVFQSNNLYLVDVDFSSHVAVFEEVKTQIIEAMKGLSEESALYNSLNYCVQSEITLMPLVVGLCRIIAVSQEAYFSQTSAYTAVSAVDA